MTDVIKPEDVRLKAEQIGNLFESVGSGDIEALSREVSRMAEDNMLLRESLHELALAMEDRNWTLLSGIDDNDQIPLRALKASATKNRDLAAINPLIKRAISVRTSYVWGEGVEFEGGKQEKLLKDNKKFFTLKSYTELERTLDTDGNLFLLLEKKGRSGKITRIPFKQITGFVTNPDDAEDVWFWQRSYNRVEQKEGNSNPETKEIVEWYPADDYAGEWKPTKIGDHPVVYGKAILSDGTNMQVGWSLGIADVTAVAFWAKAYKESLENAHTLSKALARIAWTITTKSPAATRDIATKVATPPTIDPRTGQYNNAGASVALGEGQSLQAVNKSGSGVNFAAGAPLAAMVAAGMDLTLPMITADPTNANRSASETLDEPTIKGFIARRKFFDGFFARLFAYFGQEKKIIWPKIQKDAPHRVMQSLGLADAAGVLFDEEVRTIAIEVLGIENAKEGLPERRKVATENLINGQQNQPDGSADAVPAQGKSGSVGPLADDDNELRDAGDYKE
jgi:hypothetical protein